MSKVTGLLNNKRVLLAGGVLLVLLFGLWFSPRTENFGLATVRSEAPVVSEAGKPALDTRTPLDIADGFDRAFAGAVGAFDCGSGSYIGAVEPGRPYKLVNDRGDGWVEVDIKGSGKLCVKASELVN